jgi:hypothetical protein
MTEKPNDKFILNTMDGIRIISKPEPQPDKVISTN